MTRAETIEALKKKRTTLEKWASGLRENLGPYPHGPGREQLICWELSVQQINDDLEALMEKATG